MKKKKITKIISFLLVLILLISFPLQTQANALAVEPWMIYALITYLAGMGITFTVSGGVDAMIQAMEEKVKDYEQANNVIDFYEYFRNNNIKFVPNNNQDPEGNNFFDLFFTASAVEAIQAFANWLKGDGEWSNGYSNTDSYSMFLSSNDGGAYYEPIYICDTELINDSTYAAHYKIIGEPTLIQEGFEFNGDSYQYIYNPTGYNSAEVKLLYFPEWTPSTPSWQFVNGGQGSTYQFSTLPSGYDVSDIIGYTVIFLPGYVTRFSMAIVFSDYTCTAPKDRYMYTARGEITNVSQSIDIVTPEELQEQFPSVNQGVSILDAISVPMGDPSLIEWAERMEDLFIQTGTIPQPIPEVIPDPDFAPLPTPVPTPVPSPEIEDIEDLGLPTLGDAIFSKFPFSLPKDVGRIFNLLHAEPVTPYWQVDLTGDALGIPSNFEVDLAEYEILGQITRWFSVISYCLFLILITRGMIKW